MNKTVERAANDFFFQAIDAGVIKTIEFPSRLKNELSNFYKSADKFDFLNLFLTQTDEHYKNHLKECRSPKTCPKNHLCENAIFYAEQEKEKVKQTVDNEAIKRAFGTYIGSINISGGNAVVAGEIKDTIINNSQQLESAGFKDISNDIRELTKAIEAADEIPDKEKAELLDTVNFISEQALLKTDERTNKSVLKSIIKSLFDTLSAASSVSTISGITLKEISKYFLEN